MYSTPKLPTICLNTADRSCVVFFTASGFLGQKAPELLTNYLEFYQGIIYSVVMQITEGSAISLFVKPEEVTFILSIIQKSPHSTSWKSQQWAFPIIQKSQQSSTPTSRRVNNQLLHNSEESTLPSPSSGRVNNQLFQHPEDSTIFHSIIQKRQ